MTRSGSKAKQDRGSRFGPAFPNFAQMRARNLTSPLLVLAAVAAFLPGCRKEGSHFGSPMPTPANVDLPDWVLDSIGPVHGSTLLTEEGIALGRRLFHEKALSDDGSMSCASCHVQANGFSDPQPFSTGTNGAVGTRNAMAIINLGWDDHFFWDGRRHSLEEQAHDPVTNPIEMGNTWPVVVERLQADPAYPGLFRAAFGTSTIDSNLVTRAIAMFERTLVSFNSRYDRFRFEGDSLALTEQEQRGLTLFMRDAHCVDCHSEELFADHALRNNGLDMVPADPGLGGVTGNPGDVGRFKVTTLRNIAATAPYMHDARFATLEQVVDFYADNVQLGAPGLDGHMFPWMAGQVDLDTQDRADLVAFLRALTDSTFLTNPAFGAP